MLVIESTHSNFIFPIQDSNRRKQKDGGISRNLSSSQDSVTIILANSIIGIFYQNIS